MDYDIQNVNVITCDDEPEEIVVDMPGCSANAANNYYDV